MGKILVITEKPQQAKALKEGLGFYFETVKHKNKYNHSKIPNIYYESDKVVIAPACGHLLTLYDVADYLIEEGYDIQKNDKGKYNWRDFSDKIPYVPKVFKYKLKEDNDGYYKGEYYLLYELIHREDVEMIYNFGDPDAEGELLIREILNYSGNRKPVKRMETKSLAPEVVADAFYNPYNANNYNGLYFEALARQQMDWLLGINYTTMITLKSGVFLPEGRLILPITQFVYNADKAIKEFVPTSTWGINFTLKYNKKKYTVSVSEPNISFSANQKSECERLCSELNNEIAVVTAIEKKKKVLNPKKLFSTPKLLSELNKTYKISLEEGAKAAQSLYLKSYIMYPRTDCEYLQTKEIDNTRKIIDMYADAGYPVKFHTNKSVFNDKKCGKAGEGGHTAIIVTSNPISQDDFEELSSVEKAVYLMILNRTLSNFAELPDIDETIVTIQCGDYKFKLRGDVVNKKGFLEFEPRSLSEELPFFYEGQVLENASFEVVERKTKAPPKATPARLVYYLEHPFDELDDENSDKDEEFYEIIKKGITLGTGHTMETIPTKVISYGYISENKGVYSITAKGRNLVELMKRLNITALDPERTVELNRITKLIGRKLFTLEQNKENIKKELLDVAFMLKNQNIVISNDDFCDEKSEIGKCPLCSSSVLEGQKVFYCSNQKCEFKLFKENAFFASFGKKEITKTMAKGFLSAKHTAKVTGLKSKNKTDDKGKPLSYGAYFTAKFDKNGRVNFELEKFVKTR